MLLYLIHTFSSPVASPRPQQQIIHPSNSPNSSSHGRRDDAKALVRARKPSIAQLRSPNKRVPSSGSATLFFGPVIPRRPVSSATPARPRPATMIAIESPMNASSTPPHSRPQPNSGRPGATSRHSYAGPNSPLFSKAGESDFGGRWMFPVTSSSPTLEFVPSREAKMGEISDQDASDFAPVEVDSCDG